MQLARIAQQAEHNYVGVRCGIMDQFVSFHGKKDHFVKLDCRALEFEYVPIVMHGYSLVLLDTQVKHTLASSEYNIRRGQCEAGIEVIKKYHPDVNNLRDVTIQMLDACSDALDPVVYKRCTYVVEENLRLACACEALKVGDLRTVGRMMNGSHDGLRDEYEVSCAELDALVASARKHDGVLGSRMMGGGFGGCTINLLPSAIVDQFIHSVKQEYASTFSHDAFSYEVRIVDGARRIA